MPTLLTLEHGQRDVVLHSENPYRDDKGENRTYGESHIHAEEGQKPIEQPAGDARHSIDFLAEDDRHLVEQHVAYNTASRTCDAAHSYRHPEGEAAIERLLYAGDGERSEAEGVEEKPRIVKLAQRTGENDYERLGDECADDVHRRGHPEGCQVKHHVAQGSAADCHGEAADEAPEPVIVLCGGMAYAGDGKRQRAENLDYSLYVVHFKKV